mmetsp:Transcript_6654/g.9032  ORF Transcript_6654/g.9032 Transcript_6654/m.9032 type:complete len:117 (+) Transcript_6654:1-351(+)
MTHEQLGSTGHSSKYSFRPSSLSLTGPPGTTSSAQVPSSRPPFTSTTNTSGFANGVGGGVGFKPSNISAFGTSSGSYTNRPTGDLVGDLNPSTTTGSTVGNGTQGPVTFRPRTNPV